MTERVATAADGREQVDTRATEQALVGLAEEVLQRDGLHASDDLFDLGITSLDLIRLLVRTKQEFGVALTGAELGETASIEHLAACVEAARNDG